MSDPERLKSEADNAFRAGQLVEARALYEEALSHRPDWVAVHNNLAMLLRVSGDRDGAETHFRKAIAIDPEQVGALSNLGALLVELDRPLEALQVLDQAIALAPEHAGAYYNRSKSQRAKGDDVAEIDDLERAVVLKPEFPEALSELGLAYHKDGRPDEAMEVLRKAIEVAPSFVEARINLGLVTNALGRSDAAIESYEEAIKIDPSNATAYYNLGVALSRVPAHEAAINAYEKALTLDPSHSEAANNMSTNLAALGRLDAACAVLERAVSINPEFSDAESNLVLRRQYDSKSTSEFRYESARAWQRRHGSQVERPSHILNTRDSDRAIKVGFVSPNICRHPVGFFLLPLFDQYDRQNVSLSLFSDNLRDDEMTDRLRNAASHWQDIQGLDTDEVAKTVAANEIDILFDLAGHTGRNRMPVFARRAAPVQVTWAGYVGATGLDAMDYLMTDERQTIPSDLQFMTEQPVYMPGNYVAFEPPANAPDVGPLPCLANGFVTFGCFNNIDKINADVVAVWSNILNAMPGSKLSMITFDLGDEAVQARIKDEFMKHGISSDRLSLRGKLPALELLAAYNQIDIALDPFPYSGGLTTLESLWMGVPVVTRRDADRFAGRHSVTHMTAAGVTELIAKDGKHYVELAAELGSSHERMTAYRNTLRHRLADSPACDGASFARHFERACRIMWQRWCRDESPSPILAQDLSIPALQ